MELERVAADRQVPVVRRAGDGAVDIGEASAAFLVPGPDFRGLIVGRFGHRALLSLGFALQLRTARAHRPPRRASNYSLGAQSRNRFVLLTTLTQDRVAFFSERRCARPA